MAIGFYLSKEIVHFVEVTEGNPFQLPDTVFFQVFMQGNFMAEQLCDGPGGITGALQGAGVHCADIPVFLQQPLRGFQSLQAAFFG